MRATLGQHKLTRERRLAVLDAMKRGPVTRRQIEETTGFKFSDVKNDTVQLVKNGLIREVEMPDGLIGFERTGVKVDDRPAKQPWAFQNAIRACYVRYLRGRETDAKVMQVLASGGPVAVSSIRELSGFTYSKLKESVKRLMAHGCVVRVKIPGKPQRLCRGYQATGQPIPPAITEAEYVEQQIARTKQVFPRLSKAELERRCAIERERHYALKRTSPYNGPPSDPRTYRTPFIGGRKAC